MIAYNYGSAKVTLDFAKSVHLCKLITIKTTFLIKERLGYWKVFKFGWNYIFRNLMLPPMNCELKTSNSNMNVKKN